MSKKLSRVVNMITQTFISTAFCFVSISYTCYNTTFKFKLLLSHVQIFDYDKLTVWPYAVYHMDNEENGLALQVTTKIFPALVYFLKAAMYFTVRNLCPVNNGLAVYTVQIRV
jgi:hypothetical protein